ncbi:MAG: hypothetical protein WD876_01425 [Candidatus Pacearchaeota archaeon]
MNIYSHISFNPKMEGIQGAINRLGGNPIWSLSHIVPVSEYECIAVFEAWDSEADEKSLLGKIPVNKTFEGIPQFKGIKEQLDNLLTPTK